jgi:hypothetical protein
MAWIKLHAGDRKIKYWFNSDRIIHIQNYIYPPSTHKATVTFAIHDDSNKDPWALSVHETPEEIIEMINAALALADRMTS